MNLLYSSYLLWSQNQILNEVVFQYMHLVLLGSQFLRSSVWSKAQNKFSGAFIFILFGIRLSTRTRAFYSISMPAVLPESSSQKNHTGASYVRRNRITTYLICTTDWDTSQSGIALDVMRPITGFNAWIEK